MLRLLVLIGLLFGVTTLVASLADRPGTVRYDWLGRSGTLTTTEALGIGAAALVAGVLVLDLLRAVVLAPGRWRRRIAERRRERGLRALSDGLLAVASGDGATAQRAAREAGELLPDEPLSALLAAQRAQMAGDRSAAEDSFARLGEGEATRLLGLRGLYVEALRRGERTTAHALARAAHARAPAVAWAADAALEAAAAEGDWDAALGLVDSAHKDGHLDRSAHRRLRAVLLTERARAGALQTSGAGEAVESARKDAAEAHALAPELVPAAVLAARLLHGRSRRQAQSVLDTTVRLAPHPDLFAAAVEISGAAGAAEALRAVQGLAGRNPQHEECIVALAAAALSARDLPLARSTLSPLLQARPSQRVCLAMAELEAASEGEEGSVREWLARAVRAPRDPAWVADGIAFAQWRAVSPVSGKLDRHRWQVPPGGDGDALGPSIDLEAFAPRRSLASPNSGETASADEAVDEAGSTT